LRKRIMIRMALIAVLILIGIFLYTTGKEHKVLIDNKDIMVNDTTYNASAVYKIWVDNQEIGVIEKGKRIMTMVTGTSHKMVVEEISDQVLSGEKYERIFKFKNNEGAVINIPAMINSLNEWINKK